MHKLWNSAGEQILQKYEKEKDCECKFRVRTIEDDKYVIGDANDNYQVSFLIDATASMQLDIN